MASYRKKHIRGKIHNIRPRKSIFKRLWFWIFILIVVVALSSAYFVLFYSGFQLKNIIISGNSNVKTQDLQDIISEDANTGLINFWDMKIISRSIFLINDGKISKDILEKFPEIEGLAIKKNMPQTLILGITERKPIGVYCSANDQCFLIDQNGVVFGNSVSAPTDITIVRQNTEDGQLFPGKDVIAQNIISAIAEIQKSLKDNFQIDLKEALVTSPVRLNITTNKKWQIYFDLSPDSDVSSQIIKLNLLLNGGISPNDMKNLIYIDLRPKDRAIVCDNATCGG